MTIKLVNVKVREASPDPLNFRLKAIDGGNSLEVYVLSRSGDTAAHFKLKEANSDFILASEDFSGSDIWVKNSNRHFMAQRASGNLTMVIPDPSAEYETPLLDDSKDAFRVVSTSQSTDPAPDHPSFFERFDSIYFMQSRASVEPIAQNISSPKRAAVPRTEVMAMAHHASGAGAASDPWLTARALLSPTLTLHASAQSGNADAPVQSALVTRDAFFFAQEKAAPTQRPSVQVSFQTAFHPHVAELTHRLQVEGVDGVLSLDSQSLGNPYLRAPWNPGYVVAPNSTTGASSVIEGGVGRDPVSGRPGNFEVVVLEGSRLAHYRHDSSDVASTWTPQLVVTNKATGPGCLTERVSERHLEAPDPVQRRGTFDVAVLQADGLAHYSWPNTQPPQWTSNGIITADAVGPAYLIETDYALPGQHSLELLVPEKTTDPTKWRLARYRMNSVDSKWSFVDVVSDDVSGSGCFLQSTFSVKGHGRLEALVLERNPLVPGQDRLVYFWKDETVADWQRGLVVSETASGPASIIESRVQDSLLHGNFEALVLEGRQLVHYWRDNSITTQPWHRGQVISTKASGSGCIIESHFGNIGNFEVVVPESGSLQHYWHANEGDTGSVGERFYFLSYQPSVNVDDPYPRNDIAFASNAPYALYNWELFFHLPMLAATRLMRNQRFGDARRWFHRVFNPTDDSKELTTQRFWKFLPLRNEDHSRFDQMLLALHGSDILDAPLATELQDQIADWLAHPFMPHRIDRLRISAYKKFVVMKYVDHLIAEGDQFFRLDTIEAINTATQRFVMAANICGARPEIVPARTKVPSKTYADLRKAGIDDFSDAVVQLENEYPFASNLPPTSGSGEAAGVLGMSNVLYFGIPQNDKLLGYWDKIDDRLFKIRHSMNIEGVVRQLPLFEPPIDPAMLVQAAAEGISLSAALASMNAPLPFYRFPYMLQKAIEICNEVKAIGFSMLGTAEKKDAEGHSQLRASQETDLLTILRATKEQHLRDADITLDGLQASRDTAVTRWQHYQQMLGQTNQAPQLPTFSSGITDGKYKIAYQIMPAAMYTPSSRFELVDMGAMGIGASLEAPGLSLSGSITEDDNPGTKILSYEKEEFVDSFSATAASAAGSVLEALGGVLGMIPTFGVNMEPIGVGATISFGGSNLAGGSAALARVAALVSTVYAHGASRAARLSGIVLREREWGLQNDMAAKEIFQLDQQIVAARVRVDLANRELVGHDRQIENSKTVEQFLQSKFTNQDLYSWMQGELFNLYSAAFDLAFEAAKKAELCYRFERGVADSSFIQPVGYWDDLHTGLLAGERLHLALRQMEHCYEDQNLREYEVTKHVSLLSTDPLQLVRLKETGVCDFEVTEAHLDLEQPGHYFRRIKSVSLTVPCVTGPYVGVSCTLRLLESAVRFQTAASTQYARVDDNDGRFMVNRAVTQSVATSSAQNDSGMFELNFRDERYLPFEGAGAISRWRLEINGALPQFDVQTITDVILHIRYTAREGGDRLKAAAIASIKNSLKSGNGFTPLHPGNPIATPVARLFSVRHEFPNEWQKLTRGTVVSDPDPVVRSVDLAIAKARFPYYLAAATIQPVSIFLVAIPKVGAQLNNFTLELKTSPSDPSAISTALQPDPSLGRALIGGSPDGSSLAKVDIDPARTWNLALNLSKDAMKTLNDGIQDLFLIVNYTATV